MSLAYQELAWSDMFQTDVGSKLHCLACVPRKTANAIPAHAVSWDHDDFLFMSEQLFHICKLLDSQLDGGHWSMRAKQKKTDRRPIQSSVRAMHARVGEFSPMGMSLASLFLLARAFLQRSSPMPSHAAQQAERGQFAPLTPDLTKTP
jgi:hypothetical protein